MGLPGCQLTLSRLLLRSRVKVVGFDLEWKPMRGWGKEYNKVSLVQVATADEILLAQLPESSSESALAFLYKIV